MAELVDALDSKSCGLWPCQFKSDYPYHFESLANQYVARLLFCLSYVSLPFIFSSKPPPYRHRSIAHNISNSFFPPYIKKEAEASQNNNDNFFHKTSKINTPIVSSAARILQTRLNSILLCPLLYNLNIYRNLNFHKLQDC